MNKELAKKLVADFPNVFGPIDSREPYAMFGFECGDGWEPIIRKGAEKLEALIIEGQQKTPDMEYPPRTVQLKEKFASMRWYFSSQTDEMSKIISEVERKSATTCETCGKRGKVRGKGWLYCSCLEHAKPQDQDNLEVVEEADRKHKRKRKKNLHVA